MNPGIIRIVLILVAIAVIAFWLWKRQQRETGEEVFDESDERVFKVGIIVFVVVAVLGIAAGTLIWSGEPEGPALDPDLFTSPRGVEQDSADRP